MIRSVILLIIYDAPRDITHIIKTFILNSSKVIKVGLENIDSLVNISILFLAITSSTKIRIKLVMVKVIPFIVI